MTLDAGWSGWLRQAYCRDPEGNAELPLRLRAPRNAGEQLPDCGTSVELPESYASLHGTV
jgi:hypothetical protein